MKKTLTKIGVFFCIFLFLVNVSFGAVVANLNGSSTNSSSSGGFFSGIWDGLKSTLLIPTKSLISLYNSNVQIYQSLITPFDPNKKQQNSTSPTAGVNQLGQKFVDQQTALSNMIQTFDFFKNIAIAVFILMIIAFIGLAKDDVMLLKAKRLGWILLLNFALMQFGPIMIEWAVAFNFEILYGSVQNAAGNIYYDTYMILFYGLLLWLNYILFTSILIGASEQKYAQAKAQRMAFFRTIGAVAISGLVVVIMLKFITIFNSLFTSSGLMITASSDQMGWSSVIIGILLGVILVLLSLVLLVIGYLIAILQGIGFIFLSVFYVLKKSYGPAQAIGSYGFFSTMWLMFMPIAFALPGFAISLLFGSSSSDVNSQMVRAIVALLLGVISTIVYIKMIGKMYFMIRFKKALGVFSELRKATADSASAMRSAGTKAKAGAGAAMGVGAGAVHYASHPQEIVQDAGTVASHGISSIKNSISTTKDSVSNSLKNTASTISTNYKYKNFMNLGSKQDAKVFSEMEKKGLSHLINERLPGSKVMKSTRR